MNFYKSIDHVMKSNFPVYVYEFSFNGRLNFSNLVEPDVSDKVRVELEKIGKSSYKELNLYYTFNSWKIQIVCNLPHFAGGASHADDMPYLYCPKIFEEIQITEPERTVIDNTCKLLTNFAKNG